MSIETIESALHNEGAALRANEAWNQELWDVAQSAIGTRAANIIHRLGIPLTKEAVLVALRDGRLNLKVRDYGKGSHKRVLEWVGLAHDKLVKSGITDVRNPFKCQCFLCKRSARYYKNISKLPREERDWMRAFYEYVMDFECERSMQESKTKP